MIRLPNKFEGANTTLEVELNEEVDVRKLYPDIKSLETGLSRQLKRVTRFSLTVSEMTSDINEEQTISYREIIIKIPVFFKGERYYFPILSYVSNPYSFIRGYFLGFHKELESIEDCDKFTLHFEKEGLFQFDFQFKSQDSCLENCSQADRIPFLLFRNSNLEKKEQGYYVLDIEHYELVDRTDYQLPQVQIGHFLGCQVRSSKVIFSQDTFQINGIKKLEEE